MSELFIQVDVQLTRIFVPIIIILGVVSNLLNIILLTRPTLINHSCSLYFIALAITNLFYSSFLLICNLLADGYDLDPAKYLTIFCKILSYLLNFCPTLSVYFIVLATIDRYCASSINAQTRNLSNIRIARWTIGILIFILAVFFIGALIAFDISYNEEFSCIIRSDILFNRIFLIVNLILYTIVAPFLMIFFGLLTIYNTKQVRFRPVKISRYRRTEGQLSRMLLFQVGTHIVLTLPFCITFFMLILPIQIRFTSYFSIVFVICKLPFYLTVTTAFFLYILSARVYRNEFIRLLKKIFHVRHSRY
ncbi:unnamed protein product [Adineta steineri]|uniref:G-protein coupled receptors family 1 profile domain-containing protein n=1 Tax=Adineta steineri TaxID=433720 RepID=A0A818MX29_9BILA|nr:unnamed protein product [Adineta steineri]CAF3596667.1 unnamed protein product [Adineta steineri]